MFFVVGFIFILFFIFRTTKREQTLYGNLDESRRGICHLPMEPAFCERTRGTLLAAADALGLKIHPRGTCVTIEGPRFSSKSESVMFRSWAADVVNMTTVPEVSVSKCAISVRLQARYDR